MKKNNYNLVDKELDLGDLIKVLWREKIIIVFVSFICGLLGYLFALSEPQQFKVNFTIIKKNEHLINSYKNLISLNSYKRFDSINIVDDTFDFNFLDLNNLRSFLEESEKFDKFREYLKSRNITPEQYFTTLKFGKLEKKTFRNQSNYFLIFTKELDENFLLDYFKFTKKKNDLVITNNLKLLIEENIFHLESIYENNKIFDIYLKNLPVTDVSGLLYIIPRKVLLYNIENLKEMILKLEKNQFSSNIILEKNDKQALYLNSKKKLINTGVIFGLGFSILIIFLKPIFKNIKF